MRRAFTMQHIGLFVLLGFSLTSGIIQTQNNEIPLQYASTVIQYLSRVQSGQFRCLIYNLVPITNSSQRYEQLLQSLPSNVTSQYIIDDSFEVTYTNLPQKPSLIVVYLDNEIPENTKQLLMSFYVLDSNSYVMVLVNLNEPELMQPINKVLTRMRFNYVVYISTAPSDPKIIRVDYSGHPESILTEYPHPAQLFRSNVRNMHGRIMAFTVTNTLQYEDLQWMRETARFLNATQKLMPSPCSKSELTECRMKLFYSKGLEISLDQFHFSRLIPQFYRDLFHILPEAEVFLVPRGRVLNIAELFVKPFAWEVWTTLAVVLMIVEIGGLAFPRQFMNDPVMYLVCGFERGSLHAASALERFTLLPLIVFFFLLRNVYETKIISFITEKPAIADVTTIDQMIASGIKIKVNMQVSLKVVRDPVLGPHLINSTESITRMDGISAYLTDREKAKDAVRLLSNYDFQLNRPRYVQLKESRRMQLFSFWVDDQSPLIEVLYFTQKVFFESGILLHWGQQVFEADRKKYSHSTLDGDRGVEFDDLIPAWVSLGLGSLLSGTVFLIEVGVNAFSQNKISNRRIFCE